MIWFSLSLLNNEMQYDPVALPWRHTSTRISLQSKIYWNPQSTRSYILMEQSFPSIHVLSASPTVQVTQVIGSVIDFLPTMIWKEISKGKRWVQADTCLATPIKECCGVNVFFNWRKNFHECSSILIQGYLYGVIVI